MPRSASLSAENKPARDDRDLETRVVHPRTPPRQPGIPLVQPVDFSTTYAFDDAAEFALASRDKAGSGYVYTRWANPTIDAFATAVADLEASEMAIALATGMAAISCAFLAHCSSGDRIVAARQLYGGTYALLDQALPRYGIRAETFDVHDFDGIERAVDGAKMLYCETIGNPRVVVADIPRLAEIAEGAGIPLVVDNTFASPVLCRPIELGATASIHSATKFLGGHHDLMGGVVCADQDFLAPVRQISYELGPTLSPFNAWLALRGVETLALRVERTSANALEVARALAAHPDVEMVSYPALESDPSKVLADSLLGGRGGGTLGFDVAGGRERTARFQEALKLVSPAASLGGTHSLIVHAASVTHTQLSAEQLEAVGISEGFCRLSVGIESAREIVEDLEEALKASAA